jgi:glycosyltransferase involved in cell wall biosynthesis
MPPSWICCQLGAREHYAIPRVLQQNNRLIALITDAWVRPQSPISYLPDARLKERFHSDLDRADVYDSVNQLIYFEVKHKFLGTSGWELIIARNTWFQKQVLPKLNKISSKINHSETNPIIFAYSYAALDIFQFAKQKGWATVLGQIDPGPAEEAIVAHLHQEAGISTKEWQPAPEIYWKKWYQEIELADHIIVNSTWSKQCLNQVGIKNSKIQIIPLAYQAPKESSTWERTYPKVFTPERPLRVLFLGQVNLRKGILPLLEAIHQLNGQPIELWVIGSVQLEIPQKWLSHPQIRWIDSVPRSSVVEYYKKADIFILPTYSDGFAITQLEAQAWQLPIIASHYCGNVVENQRNGLLIEDISGQSIAGALLTCLNSPTMVENLSQNAKPNLSLTASLQQLLTIGNFD